MPTAGCEGSRAMRVLVLCWLLLLAMPCVAHESYSGLRNSEGRLCCGDKDCEAVDDFVINSDASVTMFSRRWRAYIRVGASKVTWIAVPGAPAHWCGDRNQVWNPEFDFVTFCAFVDPNGS
jgi:hypothetical protein